MSDLNNSLIGSEDNQSDPAAPGGGRMLVTMLLLICTLVLTSIMMIHYGMRMKGSEKGISAFSLDDLKSKGIETTLSFSSHAESETAADDPVIEQKESIHNKLGQFLQTDTAQIRWPKLKVSGLGSSKGGDGDFAIINGKQMHPGQTSKDGIKLVKVRAHDVVVEYMGEQKSLPVDLKD